VIGLIHPGYYGKGIYLTSYAVYALPYCLKAKEPALLISLVFPGNIFPVIERHNVPVLSYSTSPPFKAKLPHKQASE
jgi:hypothetical protein